MKHFITLGTCVALSLGAIAQDVTLPEGMIPLLPQGVQTTSTYLDQNVISITKNEKPLVVTDNGLMFFTAADANCGEELWVSNGTTEGTRMVKEIVAGTEGSDPKWLTAVGNLVYFSAYTAETGAELWVSDGTEAGTRMIKDIYEGDTGSAPQGLTNFYGNKLLFFAMDEESEFTPVINAELPEKWLWATDGTAEGTVRIAATPTRMDNMNGTCGYIVLANGKGMFAGYNAEYNETIWATDGTAEGTAPLLNINTTPGDANPFLTESATIDHLVSIDDKVVAFRAATIIDGVNLGVEMWVSDGTTEGTHFIGVDINEIEKDGAPGTSDFRQTYAFGNRLYFRAQDGINGAEAWCYDISQPVAAGVNPRMVKEVAHWKGKPSYNAHVSCFYPYQGYVYTATKMSLEKPDPENPGATIAFDTQYHCFARFNENNFDEYESAFDFAGALINPLTDDKENGQEWCHQFCTVKDVMFWSCQDQGNNIELWKMEGTNGKPTKVVDFPENGQVFNTRNINDVLYFMSNGQKQLYRYDFEPAGVEAAQSEANCTIYPNPASDYLTVNTNKEVAAIDVINLTGAVVAHAENNTIGLRGLANGVYVVKVTFADGNNYVEKVIVK